MAELLVSVAVTIKVRSDSKLDAAGQALDIVTDAVAASHSIAESDQTVLVVNDGTGSPLKVSE